MNDDSIDIGLTPIAEPGHRRIGAVNWVGLRTLTFKEIHRFLKVWTQTVAAPTITTCLFMAIFVWALGGTGRSPAGVALGDFLAPGLMIMAVLQNAYQNPTSSILIAKISGSIVDVLMPPLSAGELTFSYVVGGVVRGISVGAALWLAFWLWPGVAIAPIHWWAVIYFLFAAATFMSLFGILTAVWAEKFDHAAAINNFFVVPLTLLSGTFYTIDRLPKVLQSAADFNPFFYLIDGFRYGFIGRADSDLVTGIMITSGINVVLWIAAYYVFRTGYKLKP
jgi:ABC-2 type transport system permease protein